MKRTLFSLVIAFLICALFSAQNVSVFTNVPFYSMYNYLGVGETLPPEAFSQVPSDAIRLHAYERDVISRKLSPAEIASLGDDITMNINIIAACDNYDRFAGVSLAMVPKGASTYTWDQSDVKRIELGRIITPFMNKNKAPLSTPYSFKLNNLSKIIHSSALASTYDFWIEFRADGYSAAANTEVVGCAGRTDVFRGDLQLVSSGSFTNAETFLLPLKYRENLNNYNATDVPGKTTRIVNFTLDQNVDNAKLFFIMSNHGANANGEEYIRRDHFIYLDDQLIFKYKPGGKSCEPFRANNTQGNGIYSASVRPLRSWLSNANWCPGDAIPNREISLGNLPAGNHSIKIDVPDAVFAGGQGYFPISMYIQNSESGKIICAAPSDLKIVSQIYNAIKIDWKENGSSTNWETLWGRKKAFATSLQSYKEINGSPEDYRENLLQNYYFYEMYVKSKCAADNESEWVGPIFSEAITLGTSESLKNNFSVYPNPARDIVNVKTTDSVKSIDIYTIEGRKILQQTTTSVNVSKLPKANYLMKITFTNGKTATQKITKE